MTTSSDILTGSLARAGGASGASALRLHFLGHSSFVLDFAGGPKVLTDYGVSDVWSRYGYRNPIHGLGSFVPDIYTVSHEHEDHFGGPAPEAIPHILRGGAGLELAGLSVRALPVSEKDTSRSDNFAYLFRFGPVAALHLGDAQALLLDPGSPAARLLEEGLPRPLDLLLLPVGFTAPVARAAADFARRARPRTVVPMHAWSERDLTDFAEALHGDFKLERRDTPRLGLAHDRSAKPRAVILAPGPYGGAGAT